MNIKKKVFEGTWRDRKGVSETYYLQKSPVGLRISVHKWEDGTAEVRLIKGDGRNSNFKEYRNAVVSHEEADTVAMEWVKELKTKRSKDGFQS